MEKEKHSVEEYERQGMEKYSYKFQEETLEETPNNEKQKGYTLEQMMDCWNAALKFEPHGPIFIDYITSLKKENKKQMNNKEQTAVEWLVEELLNGKALMPSIIEKAKEMENNQHANTWDDSRLADKGDNYIGKQKSFNEYYEETYGGNK
jgi:hypothetical protein